VFLLPIRISLILEGAAVDTMGGRQMMLKIASSPRSGKYLQKQYENVQMSNPVSDNKNSNGLRDIASRDS